MPPLLRALEQRNFRYFFIGQCISLVGLWIQQIAIGWLVYRLSESALILGLTTFANHIPVLLLAPFGGIWADRIDRRRALICVQWCAMLVATILTVLTFIKLIAVWHIIVGALLMGVINAFDLPMRQSFVIDLVGSKEHLPNALALNSLLMNGTRFIGPTLGGFLLAWAGEAWCFLINAVTFIAIIVALHHIKTQTSGSQKAANAWHKELAEAIQFARNFAPTRILLPTVACISFFGGSYMTLLPVFARDILGGDARILGWLAGAAGLGATLGMGYLAWRNSITGLSRVTATACACAGVGLVVFSQSKALPLSLIAVAFVGFGVMVTTASSNIIQQSTVPDHLRGRLVSFHAMAFLGVFPVGAFISGILAEQIGAATALTLNGFACLVTWSALLKVRHRIEHVITHHA